MGASGSFVESSPLIEAAAAPPPQRPSWRDASGRVAGREGYQLGDATRWLLRQAAQADWKGLSGRPDGPQTYQFGDITKAVARTSLSLVASVVLPAECRESSCRSGSAPAFRGDLSAVWVLFFEQTRLCGLEALAEGLISKEDAEAEEPYLFLGLPGLCFVELAARSLDLRGDRLRLASGQILHRRAVPNEDGAPQLFQALLDAREGLRGIAATGAELQQLRCSVLYAGSEGPAGLGQAQQGRRAAQVARVASLFQQVATEVSQLPFFKAHFQEVLQSVAAA